MSRKTKKLKCVVTGKVLTATLDYYERKVEKAGSESALWSSYICKEAKNLLIKGYSVDKIRDLLEVKDDSLSVVSQDIIDSVTKTTDKQLYRRVNTFNSINNMIF